MRLQSLRVVHLLKSREKASRDFDIPSTFRVDSCQRWLWICDESSLSSIELPDEVGFEVFAGSEAYRFLLRVATGLESQILGETDIFGQLKESWQRCNAPLQLRFELNPWIQRLFEDTKEIRSLYLQNLGGASYGTLVRRIIREREQTQKINPSAILMIGAGNIARSIAPYLNDHELWIWNRSPENLSTFYQELQAERPGIKMIENAEAERFAWRSASHIVICTPLDSERDLERIQLIRSRDQAPTIIHLGTNRNQSSAWSGLNGFHSLDDLFDLQKIQSDVRSVQIVRAKRACDERSKLRDLGASLSTPHGWEDLAAFG